MTQQALLDPGHIEVSESSDDRYTPPEVLEPLSTLWPGGVDLDPCWDPRSLVRARMTYTLADDCLTKDWDEARTIFLNPPWSDPFPFLNRLYCWASGGREGVTVTKLDPSTFWWQQNIWLADAICFPFERVRFLLPSGERMGTPAFCTAVTYFGSDPQRFADAYRHFGKVLGT